MTAVDRPWGDRRGTGGTRGGENPVENLSTRLVPGCGQADLAADGMGIAQAAHLLTARGRPVDDRPRPPHVRWNYTPASGRLGTGAGFVHILPNTTKHLLSRDHGRLSPPSTPLMTKTQEILSRHFSSTVGDSPRRSTRSNPVAEPAPLGHPRHPRPGRPVPRMPRSHHGRPTRSPRHSRRRAAGGPTAASLQQHQPSRRASQ